MERLCSVCRYVYGFVEKEPSATNGGCATDKDCGSREQCAVSSDSEIEPPPEKVPKCDHAPLPGRHCPGCLGVLDSSFVDDLSVAIRERYGQEGYVGVETFSLSFCAPLSLLVRKRVLDLQTQCLRGPSHPLPHSGYVKEELRDCLRACLEPRLHPPLSYDIHSPFQVTVTIDHGSSESDCTKIVRTNAPNFKSKVPRGKRGGHQLELNIGTVTNALEHLTSEELDALDIFTSPLAPCSYQLAFFHKSIFIAGRYNKYSRALSQTPWIVDGVRKSDTSVQELIQARLMERVRASEVKFSSSGREDVDVRMLGRGRPFLLEFLNPKKVCFGDGELCRIQAEINSNTELVAVSDLQLVGKEAAAVLKDGGENKTKLYSATIWTPQEISRGDLVILTQLSELTVHQKTPIRVLHRRTLATRERVIHTLEPRWLDPHHFSLRLSTQAGTYIKEFVHGDFGRTRPSLRDLMKQEVDILTLDVEDVVMEWPQAIQGDCIPIAT